MKQPSLVVILFALNAGANPALGQPSPKPESSSQPIPRLCAARIEGEIRVDGKLHDDGWERACRVERWFETQPGDNTPPKVQNLAYVAYDDRYLYVGFDLQDPEPSLIRAPLADRDGLTPYIDHVGVLIDARNDGKTGQIFAVNGRGVQYDSVMDDALGTDDASPDFHWDSAASIDSRGWTAEIRIPFSTLRYADRNPETWHIVFYRILPRTFWTVIQSTTIPRGVNCWVCRASPLHGLSSLPPGGGVIAAPYVNGRMVQAPRDGLRSPLVSSAVTREAGLDVKWTPTAGQALDVTVNPDFSQIEADVTQIGANERFALLYPEKRPFFLEGSNLLTTPIQAIHTRTVTDPQWGAKATGRAGLTSYTALIARDEGGGRVVLPGPENSAAADQDFGSYALFGRLKHDIGSSLVGVLVSDREVDGGGSNRVLGPDFDWRPNMQERVVGQFLVSRSVTPRRSDLAREWNGRRLAGYAGDVRWLHTTSRLDWEASVRVVSDEFRADNGFVPQVGYRRAYGEAGWTFRPEGVLRQIRPYVVIDRFMDRGGSLLSRQIQAGLQLRGRWNLRSSSRLSFDRLRTGPAEVPRTQFVYDVIVSPSQMLPSLQISGAAGQAVDFMDHRPANGSDVGMGASLRPSAHLELQVNTSRRTLWTRAMNPKARLLRARVERLRATYSFSRRSFLRLIAEYAETARDSSHGTSTVGARSANFTGSMLFAYKVNWQTVFFAGYGDERELTEDARLVPARRQVFVKMSYAFQR